MTEGTIATRGFTNDELRSLGGFKDAMAHVGDVELVSDILGTGFDVLTDKDKLVGEAFLILEWRFSNGEQGEFVSALVVTQHDEKLVVNDGGTGIYAQLKTLGESRPIGVPKGLTKSEYFVADKPDADGKRAISRQGGPGFSKAETFYLSTGR